MRKRLLSGIQPTGKMHLGNYFGAVQAWVTQQDHFDCYFMIADYHALTSLYGHSETLSQAKLDLVLDLLALGISPEKCTLFYQSAVPEHTELHLLLSMITPLPWLYRIPSYKSKMDEIQDKDLDTYGFLGYPVLQSADILIYQADVVPVGKDQLPHLELTREIARRFNHLYTPTLKEPQDMLTAFPTLVGLDGRKMSKSYGNTIPISGTEDDTKALVMKMFTDPTRLRRNDPGHPENCPVFSYHKIFNTPSRLTEIEANCKDASLGCVDCKKECGALVATHLAPIRDTRQRLAMDMDYLSDVLSTGAKKAKAVASQTLLAVKDTIGL